MKWVALFSQTGSEIYEISKLLDRFPDAIICNKQDDFDSINQNLVGKAPLIFTDSNPTVEDYLKYIKPSDFATMHGWLKIVPKEVCTQRTIYNGHPGLITKYPELKGKDPQLKALELGHLSGGCVIHEATAKLDGGPIAAVSEMVCFNGLTEDQVFEDLHKASVYMWVQFLKGRLQ